MEVMSPRPTSPDFHFDGSSTVPSSPRLSGELFNFNLQYYTSAPTSPTRATAIFSHFKEDNEFAFDSARFSISHHLPEISTADELFDNGKIRPLQPRPPFVERGRKRSSFSATDEDRARSSRSLSPLRDHTNFVKNTNLALPKNSCGSRKWRLKDLLLFRSASEGRAVDRESRDPLRKYTLFPSIFSSSTTSKKKGGPVASPHEMHYTANRVAAGEQRKKTTLAYQRQGFFDFIQYNPAIRSIAKGFGGNSSRS